MLQGGQIPPKAEERAKAKLAPEVVRAELEKILRSRPFLSSKSLSRFLRYIVEHTLAGKAGQVKEYLLGVDVLGRGESFDPRLDTIVRVEARRLRAKLSQYYETEGRNDPVVIEFRKGSYVPLLRPAADLPAPSPSGLAPFPRTAWWAAAVAAALLLAGALLWWMRPPAVPRVIRTVQLTHLGRVDMEAGNLVTDGARIYFVERRGGRWKLAQVSSEGGEPVSIETPFPNTRLFDISPGRFELLVGATSGLEECGLWAVPLPSGSPRPLGGAIGHDAAWSPDGRKIVFAQEKDLYVIGNAGTGPRKLASVAGIPHRLRWSPDGRRLRFTMVGAAGGTSLWEIFADGSGLRPLFPHRAGLSPEEGERDGVWLPGQNLFLFRSYRLSDGRPRTTLVAVRDRSGLFRGDGFDPIPFYESPLQLSGPTVSADGVRLFVVGKQPRYELMKYDKVSRRLTPYLAGIPATGIGFSRDGEWVTYSTKPEGTIWRSKADGSERLQLTFPPMRALYPRWSPDGTRIAVAARFPPDVGRANGIYIVSRDGGNAELIAEEGDNPNWSPDGKTILFRCGSQNDAGVCKVDAATKAVRPVAGSQRFGEPSWSPDGRWVVAHSDGYRRLMLLDCTSGGWRELAAGTYLFGSRWSRDSREVYYQDTLSGIDQPIFRVRVSDRRAERVGPPQELLPSDVVVWGLTGLTPDGYPLITVVRNNADIYALDLK